MPTAAPERDLAPSGAGPRPARVAEVIVSGERAARGCGYRVTDALVLTAGHVLDDAVNVDVRFDAGFESEWTVRAHGWRRLSGTDVALIDIDPPSGAEPVAPVRYGRIGDRAAGIVVQAIGFPRWKLRPDPDRPGRYREPAHVVGSVATLSNRRGHTLEIVVPSPPAAEPDPRRSPWEGMSGAAVWVGNTLVGVVTEHHPAEGLARLSAVRLDHAIDRLDDAERAALSGRLPFPAHSRLLVDVLPPPAWRLSTSAHQAQLGDIAPETLVGRGDEVDAIVRFCADDCQYALWQAPPWAGKTALMSSVALHPPAGVDVVSFFITSRLAGQSDSNSFTSSLIEQLAALVEEDPAGLAEAGARRGHLLRLLTAAADQAQATGRRLLLIVDGLDEDRSLESGSPIPSIASLLPRRPPANVRVLVSSRPDPPLPLDVPADHPLRAVDRWQLAPSDHGRDIEATAKDELRRLFRGPALQRDVLALLTASGGGLSGTDLEALTSSPPYLLEDLLSGQLGRSVSARPSAIPGADGVHERVYLFGHGQLQDLAVGQFGGSLGAYLTQIHSWAERFAQAGWPADTPAYLLRGYARRLATRGDTARMIALATDRARHACLLARTGGDMLALEEVADATVLAATQGPVDLGALLRLAYVRDELLERNRNVPVRLPAVWAAAGQTVRAVTLAREMRDARARVGALCAVIRTLSAAGQRSAAVSLVSDAEEVLNEVRYYADRDRALFALASAVLTSGDYDRAERIAWDIADHAARSRAMHHLVAAMVDDGHPDLAHDSIRALESTMSLLTGQARDEALQGLAVSATAAGVRDVLLRTLPHLREPRAVRDVFSRLGQAGQFALADQAIEAVNDTSRRAIALAELAVTGRRHDEGRARAYLERARAQAQAIHHPPSRAGILREIEEVWSGPDLGRRQNLKTAAIAAARAGDLSEVFRTVRYAGDQERRARLLLELCEFAPTPAEHAELLQTGLRTLEELGDDERAADLRCEFAVALIMLGRLDEGVALAVRVESTARAKARPIARNRALRALAPVLARAGRHDRASRLFRLISEPAERAELLGELVGGAAEAGDLDAVARLRAATDDPVHWDEVLIPVIVAARTRDAQDVDELAGQLQTDSGRAQLRQELARPALAHGDLARVHELVREASSDRERVDLFRALARNAPAPAVSGLVDLVVKSVPLMGEAIEQIRSLVVAAEAVRGTPRTEALLTAASRIFAGIFDELLRARALVELMEGVLAAGEPERARQLLTELPPQAPRDVAVRLAVTAARVSAPAPVFALVEPFPDARERQAALGELTRVFSRREPQERAAWLEQTQAELAVAVDADPQRYDRLGDQLAVLYVASGDLTSAMNTASPGVARELRQIHHELWPPARPVTGARSEPEPGADPPLSQIVRNCAEAGDHQRAEQLAGGLTGAAQQVALRWLAELALARGDHARTQRLARLLQRRRRQEVLSELLLAAVADGDFGRVEAVATELGEPNALARALTEVAVRAQPVSYVPVPVAGAPPTSHVSATIALGLARRPATAAGVEQMLVDVIGSTAWPAGLDAVALVALPALLSLSDDLDHDS